MVGPAAPVYLLLPIAMTRFVQDPIGRETFHDSGFDDEQRLAHVGKLD
jgi:hypothetical protein